MPNCCPQLELPAGVRVISDRPAPSASSAEAAAIMAALERFMRDTAPPTAPPTGGVDPWLRAAMLEGVSREGPGDTPDPWINT